MKRMAIGWILAACAAAASAQTPALPGRDEAVQYLESTREGVMHATAGLSEAQWSFKAAPDRWSIAEVTEHIAAGEDLLRGMIEDQVLKAPPRSEKEDVGALDALVLRAVPDRTRKAEAPEALRPTNRFGSPEEALKHFVEARDKTLALLKSRDDLRDHATESPLGKKLDAYEWILFAGAHSERHTKQIEEVRANPNFPKQ